MKHFCHLTGQRSRSLNSRPQAKVLAIVLASAAAIGLFSACGDGPDATPTVAITVPPASPTTATEASPTAAVSATQPPATATAATPAATPTANRTTGVAEVDAIMAAILSGDAAKIRTFVAMTSEPCTTLTGLGGPPQCPAGVAAGTIVQAFPSLGPSLGWSFDADGVVTNLVQVTTITGVFKAIPRPYSPTVPGLPSGSYVLVAAPDRLIHIDGGKIVFMDYVMAGMATRLAAIPAADFILPIQ